VRICLLCPAPTEWADVTHSVGELARVLADRHEVLVVRTGHTHHRTPPDPASDLRLGSAATEIVADLDQAAWGFAFADEDHRHAACAMAAIRSAYGEDGPDYIEVPDFRAHGLVALQARRSADPLLAKTTIGVRLCASTEMISLHDGTIQLPGRRRLSRLELEQLRLADVLVWPGGDCLELLRRHHPSLELPPDVRIPPPEARDAPAPAAGDGDEGPLRILYAAPLQRSRGAVDLAEACLGLEGDGWSLTMAGEDTETAPAGQSVRMTIESMGADDPRIRFEAPLSPVELERRAAEFDLLAVPSRVEAWSPAAIAAMRAGLPVLATPIGGLVEIVDDGAGGWLADGLGPEALGRALNRLLRSPGEAARARRDTAAPARAASLSDPERALAEYERLAEGSPPPPAAPPAPPEPLVTGVITYHGLHGYVSGAVASLLGQTHANLEVLVVNDGSFGPDDAVLEELGEIPRVTIATQINRGEAVARNLGAVLARGEYVVMLDADNMLEPGFVERALATFRRNPHLAYVTCWLRMVAPEGEELPGGQGYAALGNRVLAEGEEENWDGDTLAMLPRAVFVERGLGYKPDGSIHSDWSFYRALRRLGAFGAVIPEQLARYRVRPDSLLRHHDEGLRTRGWADEDVWKELASTRWTAEVG
jgi:glycogen synthase